SSAVGAIAVVLLGSMAFGAGGKHRDQLTVSREVTTTTEGSSDRYKPLVTGPATTATSTSTTVAATSTTALPVATTTTAPETTTTAPTPARFTVAFDRDRLVIQSGTSETISYTVTNHGGERGRFEYPPDCVHRAVWPADQSSYDP